LHFQFSREKKNVKRAHSLLSAAQNGKNQLGPAHRARAGRTQAATWAWAGNAAPVRSPAWAAGWPIQSRPSVLIRRPSAHLAEYKTATPRPLSKP